MQCIFNPYRLIKLGLIFCLNSYLPVGLGQETVSTGSWLPMACWFWGVDEFKPDGYKPFIDQYEKYSATGVLTASLRSSGELTDENVVRQIRDAAQYAQEKGLGLVMDLDIRLARAEFRKRYPQDLQEIVLVREFPLDGSMSLQATIELPSYSDHYTAGRYPYGPVGVRLERLYSYEKDEGAIKSSSLKDITSYGSLAGGKQLSLSVPHESNEKMNWACALIVVTINTPDLFSINLLRFQREVLKLYAGSGLIGAAKDEWGFPGRFHPTTDDLWYSEAMASVYREKHPGHELIRDILLMAKGEQGREADRKEAINRYMRMIYERNWEIEGDFFESVKELFGIDAMVGTHPTWYPYPNAMEIFKNGLSWWNAKRELAQTDEATPFSVRTALAKKWGSAVWYNMFYDTQPERYAIDIWRAVLGGGRLNIHPPYPSKDVNRKYALLEGELFQAIQRIHLLDYISSAPVHCPVAIVFDHSSVLNWADQSRFADVGFRLADALWEKGVYADLIPSSEIVNGAVTIAENGKIRYGTQLYEVAVYYKPGYDNEQVSALFDRVLNGATSIFQTEGQPDETIQGILQVLKKRRIPPQTTGSMIGLADFPPSVVPDASGHIRLIDGTFIAASGSSDVMGDPIKRRFYVDGHAVNVDAEGLVGLRFDKSGKLQALACGGLKSFRTGNVRIDLPDRLDIALFKEAGEWRGIIHGEEQDLPGDLAKFTVNWQFVKQPHGKLPAFRD